MTGKGKFDLKRAAARVNEENRKETEREIARRAEARQEGRRLAASLRQADPKIARIWGFGSAFEDSRSFRMDSDIDLAIEGGDIVTLYSIVLSSPFKVDLIDITGKADEFAESIRERGIALYRESQG